VVSAADTAEEIYPDKTKQGAPYDGGGSGIRTIIITIIVQWVSAVVMGIGAVIAVVNERCSSVRERCNECISAVLKWVSAVTAVPACLDILSDFRQEKIKNKKNVRRSGRSVDT